MEGLQKQGFRAKKTSDRFRSGEPDIRVGRRDLGQLDIELKYYYGLRIPDGEFETSIRKLQWLRIIEMNQSGMPAIGLVYIPDSREFLVTSVLRDTLSDDWRRVPRKLPPSVIDGVQLFGVARRYIEEQSY